MYKFALAAGFFVLAFAVTVDVREGQKGLQPAREIAGHFRAEVDEASMQHLTEASAVVETGAFDRR